MTHPIRENAPEILKRQTTIELTNQQFDDFMAASMDEERAFIRSVARERSLPEQ